MLLGCLTRSTRKADGIVPESHVALSLSLTIGALTLSLSATLTAPLAISNYLLALADLAHAGRAR